MVAQYIYKCRCTPRTSRRYHENETRGKRVTKRLSCKNKTCHETCRNSSSSNILLTADSIRTRTTGRHKNARRITRNSTTNRTAKLGPRLLECSSWQRKAPH